MLLYVMELSGWLFRGVDITYRLARGRCSRTCVARRQYETQFHRSHGDGPGGFLGDRRFAPAVGAPPSISRDVALLYPGRFQRVRRSDSPSTQDPHCCSRTATPTAAHRRRQGSHTGIFRRLRLAGGSAGNDLRLSPEEAVDTSLPAPGPALVDRPGPCIDLCGSRSPPPGATLGV